MNTARPQVPFLSPVVRALMRAHDSLTQLSFWGAMLAVLYLTVVTGWGVIGRYLLGSPASWTYDTATVSFALVTFFAAPMLTWKMGHASMNAVVEALPTSAARWMRRFTMLLGASACVLVAWYAGNETLRLYNRGVMMIAVTPIPKWWVMAALTYGVASMALYFFRHLFDSSLTAEATHSENS
ncbi:TRAP transporter small permease subunit [Billgrantia diversa]|uniref:TRAP transporter small permease n=1 Tax=Halomonas sp. MCCC 1A13316 TaxID=2733487 RepID=UPI0018A5BE01|nr:TRAP transporter small permease subunit [Halomonas sp. MCCC 1A13316]QOR37721.1 TRAP transporter small permease subunit [Halomonas sp. MCCC 1A13316]